MNYNVIWLDKGEKEVGGIINSSKRKFHWRFKVNEAVHIIELAVSYYSEKMRIFFDGNQEFYTKEKSLSIDHTFSKGLDKFRVYGMKDDYNISVNNYTYGTAVPFNKSAPTQNNNNFLLNMANQNKSIGDQNFKHNQGLPNYNNNQRRNNLQNQQVIQKNPHNFNMAAPQFNQRPNSVTSGPNNYVPEDSYMQYPTQILHQKTANPPYTPPRHNTSYGNTNHTNMYGNPNNYDHGNTGQNNTTPPQKNNYHNQIMVTILQESRLLLTIRL